ncbi:HU family DNA-binding protein [Enterococcus faecium]|uniref:DNA-binding protein HU n=1 Tax=Enterococcus faecium TaxID=1352 RepID=A0A242BEA2_ENTFC|nr:HU family DNA-binding protein [Enterococcus faecium]OTN93649.1 hypothetical protein A5810_001525 [Enterococcus faecium]
MIGRHDLAKEVAAEIEMDDKMIQNLFGLLLDKMIEHLQNGEAIKLNRFGKFLIVEKSLSTSETGEQERHSVRYVEFVPGSELSDKSMNR